MKFLLSWERRPRAKPPTVLPCHPPPAPSLPPMAKGEKLVAAAKAKATAGTYTKGALERRASEKAVHWERLRSLRDWARENGCKARKALTNATPEQKYGKVKRN